MKLSGEVTLCEVGRIYISRNSVVRLSLRALEIVEFNSHLHSWAVKKTETKLVKQFTDLCSVQMLPIRQANYDTDILHYVTLKYEFQIMF